MNPIEDLQGVMGLLLTDPMAAADAIDAIADKLRARAAEIRAACANPFQSQGGIGDSCKIVVTGPDGMVKQRVDTSRN